MQLNTKQILEAALFAADDALSVSQLGQLFDEHERPENREIKVFLDELRQDYAGRGVELQEVASGYRFQTSQEVTPWIKKLWLEKPPRYSRALMETLAIITYRQPLTRAEIEDIRGVSLSTNIMRTLMEREWIRIAGYKNVPGKPALFITTSRFLDDFNLKSLKELPKLDDIRDLDSIAEQFEIELENKEEEGGVGEPETIEWRSDSEESIEPVWPQEEASEQPAVAIPITEEAPAIENNESSLEDQE